MTHKNPVTGRFESADETARRIEAERLADAGLDTTSSGDNPAYERDEPATDSHSDSISNPMSTASNLHLAAILEEMRTLKETITKMQREKEANVPINLPLESEFIDDIDDESDYGHNKNFANHQSLAFKQAFKGVLDFSGERMTERGSVKAEDFIRSIEVALALTEVPEMLAITYIVAKLKGSARNWYERHQMETLNNKENIIRTWSQLKDLLLKRFGSDMGIIQYERELFLCKQGNKAVSSFSDEFQQLVAKIPGLSGAYIVACYVNRLDENIGKLVRSHVDNLKDLKTAIRSAILIEAQIMLGRTNSVEEKHEEKASKAYHRTSFRKKFDNSRTQNLGKNNSGTGEVMRNKSIICRRCNKPGHIARMCFSKTNGENRDFAACAKEVIEIDYAKAVTTGTSLQFTVDSGCTRHMVCDATNFQELREHKSSVLVPGNRILDAVGIGTIPVDTNLGYGLILQEVLYVPQLGNNLLSVRKLYNNGIKPDLEGKAPVLFKNNIPIANGDIHPSEYLLTVFPRIQSKDKAQQATSKVVDEYQQLHEELGHPGRNKMELLMMLTKHKIARKSGWQCSACNAGKQARLPFPKIKEQSVTSLGQLVVADICGPIRGTSVHKYFLLFLDAYSGYVYTEALPNKSAMLVNKSWLCFQAWFERQTGKKILRFRSDNGTEFNELRRTLHHSGVEIHRSVPYTPEQNGMAERMNRTILEKMRTILDSSGFETSLWPEILATATHYINRTPRNGMDQSPLMIIRGTKIFHDLSYFKRIGNKVSVLLHDGERENKLNRKTKTAYLIGYGQGTKSYRLIDPTTKEIFESRNVKFIDNEMYPRIASEKSLIEIGCDMEVSENQMVNSEQIEKGNQNEHQTEINNRIKYVAHKITRKGVPLYLVVWEDSTMSPTWESLEVVQSSSAFRKFVEERETDRAFSAINGDTPTLRQALTSPEVHEWRKAMLEELDSIRSMGVYDEVKRPTNVHVLGSKWVLRIKRNEKGQVSRYKARFVVQGYNQRHGIDYDETYAPTLSKESFRLFFFLASHYSWDVEQVDVQTAFLHGHLNELIYVEKPVIEIKRNVPKDKVWLLRKSLYGLKQSPRCWNKRIHDELVQNGWQRCHTDSCLYFKTKQNNLSLLLAIYVDDILIAGLQSDIKNEILYLESKFQITQMGAARFVLGIEVIRTPLGFHLSQCQYIRDLAKRFGQEKGREISLPLNVGTDVVEFGGDEKRDENIKNIFLQVLGSLLYIATSTRPDIAFSVSLLSRVAQNPTKEQLSLAFRIVRYLYQTCNLQLEISSKNSVVPIAYADSDWAGNKLDRKSTSGLVISISGSPIIWRSQKQTSLALSSVEAELVAANNAATELTWLQTTLEELKVRINLPITLYLDSTGAQKLAISGNPTRRTKHIEIKHFYITDRISKGLLKLVDVSSAENTADILTKNLPRNVFEKHRRSLNLI